MLNTTTDPISDSKPRLTRPCAEARQLLVNQIKIGQAIQAQRIVYVQDLDQARSEKQEWVTRTTDLLKQLFVGGEVVEQCNDWVGPILPEYAEWNLFVEQFASEMKHRIGRLAALVKGLEEMPVTAPEIARKAEPSAAPVAPPPPRIRWSGLLISHAADESMHRAVTGFLARLDIPVDTITPAPGEKLPHGDLVEFALILKGPAPTTSDDLFELGFCVGRFGANRVCILHHDAASADTHGVCHIQLDAPGAWQLALARHLKAGGAVIDLNRLV